MSLQWRISHAGSNEYNRRFFARSCFLHFRFTLKIKMGNSHCLHCGVPYSYYSDEVHAGRQSCASPTNQHYHYFVSHGELLWKKFKDFIASRAFGKRRKKSSAVPAFFEEGAARHSFASGQRNLYEALHPQKPLFDDEDVRGDAR